MRVATWVSEASIFIVIAAVGGGYLAWDRWQHRQRHLEEERAQRQAPPVEVAPAPLPTSLPLRGADRLDAYGYPRRTVDRAGLRSLLWHKRYADLTRYLEELQAAFEADPSKERWPTDAAGTFSSAEPQLRASLDSWVAATPGSFAPHLARGVYLVRVAHERRGHEWAYKTAPEHFAAMSETLAHAQRDLGRALLLRPRLVAAMQAKIRAYMLNGHPIQMHATMLRALATCPTCFEVRVQYLRGMTPRWGGSYEAMLGFLDSRVGRSNRALALLPGYVDLDRAALYDYQREWRAALGAIRRACQLGDHADFLEERARILRTLKQPTRALADLDRALQLRPGLPWLLSARAYVYADLKRWEAAGRDLLEALRSDPTDIGGRYLHAAAVRNLDWVGWEHHKAGRYKDAVRVYALAAQLAPTHTDLIKRKAVVAVGGEAGLAKDPAALRRRLRGSPDDLLARRQLHALLHRKRDFAGVVDLWNDYLARHPGDAEAHLWRAAGFFLLRRLKEAHADSQRACVSGLSEGCARAKQVAAMMK
jgi:tetratricopeptide (TPR) repeat protein